jgi:uncharacterized membrane protein
MNKETFLAELKRGLSGLPQNDADERLSFYGEMIDDRMEEGLSEEEAVAGIGPVDEIVAQTVAEIPLAKLVKENVGPRRPLRVWEIVLLVLGFPLWFSLLAAAAAVVLALYIVIWALIVSLWAIEAALWACALAGIAGGVVCMILGRTASGAALLGAGLFCAGLSIFFFAACLSSTLGILRLTR